MGSMHAGLLLLLFCSAYSYRFRSQAVRALRDPEEEWRKLDTAIDDGLRSEPGMRSSSSNKPPSVTPASFPMYKRVPKFKYPKEAFKPEKGVRALPDFAKELLLVPSSSDFNNWQPVPTETPMGKSIRPLLVEMLCHIDRIYVRIRNEVFKTISSADDVKFGKCSSNANTTVYTYFLYRLTDNCGFVLESKPDTLIVKNVLQYKPSGTVIREIPFTIPLQCNYHRVFLSYKVGFHPKLQGGTVYRALQTKQSATLVPVDSSGNVLTGTRTYTLGQPMYFMVKLPDQTTKSGNRRLYINKCFMTPTQNPSSSTRHVVISNQGCMVDGKETVQSKFLTSSSKLVQIFKVASFVFSDMVSTSSSSTKKLYMHCEVSVGKLTATSTSKACNYDMASKGWKELYDQSSVCSCCDTSCPSAQHKASRKTISSPSWRVDLSKVESVAVEPDQSDFYALADPDVAGDSEFVNYWEHDD